MSELSPPRDPPGRLVAARMGRVGRAGGLMARGAGRGALRGDPPRDARLGRFRDAKVERGSLPREAAPPLLGQRRFAAPVRFDSLGGAPADAPLRARYAPDAPLRDGRNLGDAGRVRGGDPLPSRTSRLRLLAREPDRRSPDVLLHADALSRSRDSVAPRGGPTLGHPVGSGRTRRRRRFPEQGTRRGCPAGSDSPSLVPGDPPDALSAIAPLRAGSPGVPLGCRAMVPARREPQPWLPPFLLHPRALPTLLDLRGEASGADLLLRPH